MDIDRHRLLIADQHRDMSPDEIAELRTALAEELAALQLEAEAIVSEIARLRKMQAELPPVPTA